MGKENHTSHQLSHLFNDQFTINSPICSTLGIPTAGNTSGIILTACSWTLDT
ncbi:hypothetical protein [Eubacterium aggregans]|uniref:hypothetical protein n=1 Tax=Eubacterium aggregans TaxID=81409 RepID=UPI003F404E31